MRGGEVHDGPGQELYPCWSCFGSVSVRAWFCHHCGNVQTPRLLDHFSRLNLPVGFDLSLPALERQYNGLRRRLQPDRFTGKSGKEQQIAARHVLALTQAYEVLRQPLRRAEYLLWLRSDPAHRANEGAGTDSDCRGMAVTAINDAAPAPESLQNAAGVGNEDLGERLAQAATAREMIAVQQRLTAKIQAAMVAMTAAFVANDLSQARQLLNQVRQLTTLAGEVAERLQQMGSG